MAVKRKKDGARTLQLGSVLDLNAAAPLKDDILALKGGDVVVDATGVERIGAQCIQVLVAARRSWQADGMSFSVGGASDVFARTIQLAGLDREGLSAKEIAR